MPAGELTCKTYNVEDDGFRGDLKPVVGHTWASEVEPKTRRKEAHLITNPTALRSRWRGKVVAALNPNRQLPSNRLSRASS